MMAWEKDLMPKKGDHSIVVWSHLLILLFQLSQYTQQVSERYHGEWSDNTAGFKVLRRRCKE